MSFLAIAVTLTISHSTLPALTGDLPPVRASRSDNEKPGLRPIAVYPTLSFVPGCTAILEKYTDGFIKFVGCPTNACPGEGNQCLTDSAPGGGGSEIYWCYCMNDSIPTGILCQSMVVMDAVGEVTDWFCIKKDCVGDCVRVIAPVWGRFYACDC